MALPAKRYADGPDLKGFKSPEAGKLRLDPSVEGPDLGMLLPPSRGCGQEQGLTSTAGPLSRQEKDRAVLSYSRSRLTTGNLNSLLGDFFMHWNWHLVWGSGTCFWSILLFQTPHPTRLIAKGYACIALSTQRRKPKAFIPKDTRHEFIQKRALGSRLNPLPALHYLSEAHGLGRV